MTQASELNYKRLLEDPQLCWREAQRRVMYEWARAVHGALWRLTASQNEINAASSSDTGYYIGVHALTQFVVDRKCDPHAERELAVLSTLHMLSRRQTQWRRTFIEAVDDSFSNISYEAAQAVENCYFLYRVSEGKDPAWKLRAIVAQTVATISHVLSDTVRSYCWDEQHFPDGFGLWLEENVITKNGSFLAAAAMQTGCVAILDLALQRASEPRNSKE